MFAHTKFTLFCERSSAAQERQKSKKPERKKIEKQTNFGLLSSNNSLFQNILGFIPSFKSWGGILSHTRTTLSEGLDECRTMRLIGVSLGSFSINLLLPLPLALVIVVVGGQAFNGIDPEVNHAVNLGLPQGIVSHALGQLVVH